MSSKKDVPQTYSRLFRPWDGKSYQDSTVTSTTTTTTTNIIDVTTINDDNNINNNNNDNTNTDSINYFKSNNRLWRDEQINQLNDTDKINQISNLNITQSFENSHTQYLSNILPSSTDYIVTDECSLYVNGSLPYIGIDPFTASVMEHEYSRVLAEEAQAKLISARKQRPKKFKCPHCDVAFSNNGQLKGHVRIHTGERPFKCDDPTCGKTFTRNEELTRHKRIHTGLRPYSCVTCGKRFGRRDHLKKHTKTHFAQERYLAPAVFLPLYPYLYGY